MSVARSSAGSGRGLSGFNLAASAAAVSSATTSDSVAAVRRVRRGCRSDEPLPKASQRESGEKAASQQTPPTPGLKVINSSPVAACQSLTLPSQLAVATVLLSGEKLRFQIPSL